MTLDTTRADYLGCGGRTDARTPNLDRLAREGARFFRCSADCSVTLPSHTSIMTGTHPYVHGTRHNATNRVAGANVTLAEVLGEAGFSTHAVIAAAVLNRKLGLDQGFDTYRDVVVRPGVDAARAQRPADQIVDDAVQVLRSVHGNRFLLWVHFYDPHYPYVARRPAPTRPEDAYADEIAFMDAQIGRLMGELRNLGLQDNTLVVIVGDHGEGLNQHDEWQHGYFVYETTLHVPLIFWKPGMISGQRVIESQVRTIDIAPTILDLLGRPPLETAMGVSLSPLISGKLEDLNLAAYAESLEAHNQLGLSPLRSLCVDGWKYVLGPKRALYHLTTDPAEVHNSIAERPELASQLHEQLRTLIAESPPPADQADTRISLSSAELDQLQSLGYVTAPAARGGQRVTELDAFEPRGADPGAHPAAIRRYEEARLALSAGHYGRAEELFREVVGAFPKAPLPLGSLAHSVHRQGKLDEAVTLYERALAMEPVAAHVRVTFAQLLLSINRFDDAVAQLAAALIDMPDDVVVLQQLGIALTSVGRFSEAREHFERALELEPDDIRVLHGMGVFYVRQNNLPKAAEMFRRALEIDPSQPRLREDLQRVLDAMGP